MRRNLQLEDADSTSSQSSYNKRTRYASETNSRPDLAHGGGPVLTGMKDGGFEVTKTNYPSDNVFADFPTPPEPIFEPPEGVTYVGPGASVYARMGDGRSDAAFDTQPTYPREIENADAMGGGRFNCVDPVATVYAGIGDGRSNSVFDTQPTYPGEMENADTMGGGKFNCVDPVATVYAGIGDGRSNSVFYTQPTYPREMENADTMGGGRFNYVDPVATVYAGIGDGRSDAVFGDYFIAQQNFQPRMENSDTIGVGGLNHSGIGQPVMADASNMNTGRPSFANIFEESYNSTIQSTLSPKSQNVGTMSAGGFGNGRFGAQTRAAMNVGSPQYANQFYDATGDYSTAQSNFRQVVGDLDTMGTQRIYNANTRYPYEVVESPMNFGSRPPQSVDPMSQFQQTEAEVGGEENRMNQFSMELGAAGMKCFEGIRDAGIRKTWAGSMKDTAGPIFESKVLEAEETVGPDNGEEPDADFQPTSAAEAGETGGVWTPDTRQRKFAAKYKDLVFEFEDSDAPAYNAIGGVESPVSLPEFEMPAESRIHVQNESRKPKRKRDINKDLEWIAESVGDPQELHKSMEAARKMEPMRDEYFGRFPRGSRAANRTSDKSMDTVKRRRTVHEAQSGQFTQDNASADRSRVQAMVDVGTMHAVQVGISGRSQDNQVPNRGNAPAYAPTPYRSTNSTLYQDESGSDPGNSGGERKFGGAENPGRAGW